MRFVRPLLLIGALGLSGCGGSVQSRQPPPRWTTGFWLWSAYSACAPPANVTLDVLFVHAGSFRNLAGPYARGPWSVDGRLPDDLSPAREYWFVFRLEGQDVPDLQAAPNLVRQVIRLREAAVRRRLNVGGVQLDIDSPTGKLSQYASFLREVRKGLPAGTGISITALLDWFRDGTAIADVIREVDEFVPQFYDVAGSDGFRGRSAIAARIDAAQWAPKFNRFGKRFRIGISTFGRARVIPKENQQRRRYLGISWYGDLTPLDVAINSAFNLQATRNEAGELVLSYLANRMTRIGYSEFERGGTVQFILSTPATIRAAVASARKMGGYSAGVVFFRWPGSEETLVMQPSEVLIAAGLVAGAQRTPAGIDLVDGGCAAVHCVDIYVVNANPFASQPLRYRIRSSTELEYFLPEEGMPVRLSGPSQLELSLPPYCGRGRMYLGRAVSAARAEFKIEEER